MWESNQGRGGPAAEAAKQHEAKMERERQIKAKVEGIKGNPGESRSDAEIMKSERKPNKNWIKGFKLRSSSILLKSPAARPRKRAYWQAGKNEPASGSFLFCYNGTI